MSSGICGVLISTFILSIGCSTIRHELEPDLTSFTLLRKKLLVPKGKTPYDCGPEALSAVMNYFRVSVDVEDIQAEIYDPKAKGTWSWQLAPFARKKGLFATYYPGTIERVKQAIIKDTPPIIMIKLSEGLYHFLVVTGFSESRKEILCRDYDTRNWIIPEETLKDIWIKACGGYYLEINIKPDLQSLINSAYDAVNRRDWAKAVECFSYVYEEKRNDPEILNDYAHSLIQLGKDLKLAESIAKKTVDLLQNDTRLPYAMATLGQAYLAQKNYSEAAKLFATILDKVDSKEFKRKRLNELIECHKQLGNTSEREKYTKILLELK